MIANTQNGFPSPFPSLGLSYWKKKSHTFAEQWDNNQLQWSFKKHDTNWFLISERFSSYDFKNWTLWVSFNFRNKWKKATATWLKRAFPTIFDCDDNFTPMILFFSWLSVGCYDKFDTGFTVFDCRATVLNHHNTVESRVWNISFWSCKSDNCTLVVFFSHAFTYIDYPIAVLDLSMYHSSE